MNERQERSRKPAIGEPFPLSEHLAGPGELLARALRAGLPQNAALVLWAIASRVGKNLYCWPSLPRVAQQVNLSERSVRRHVRELEGWKLLRTESRGPGRSQKFFLLWHAVLEDDSPLAVQPARKRSGVRPTPDKPATNPGQRGQQDHHQTELTSDRTVSVAPAPSRKSEAVTPNPLPLIKDGDDKRKPAREQFDSPEAELLAIFEHKSGLPMTEAVLRTIKENLELRMAPFGAFVAEVRRHAAGKWENPAGLLVWLSRKFVAQSMPAVAPAPARLPIPPGKCSCGGGGYLGVDPLVLCSQCSVGRDLAAIEQRRLAAEVRRLASGDGQAQHKTGLDAEESPRSLGPGCTGRTGKEYTPGAKDQFRAAPGAATGRLSPSRRSPHDREHASGAGDRSAVPELPTEYSTSVGRTPIIGCG